MILHFVYTVLCIIGTTGDMNLKVLMRYTLLAGVVFLILLLNYYSTYSFRLLSRSSTQKYVEQARYTIATVNSEYKNHAVHTSKTLSISSAAHSSPVLSVKDTPSRHLLSQLDSHATDAKKQYLDSVIADLQRYLPSDFLPGFKNPCWYRGPDLVCLPYFLVLGFPKCGTTTLWNLMKSHQDFATPLMKEPTFWPRRGNFSRYLSVFHPAAVTIQENPERRITGDFSTALSWNLPFGLRDKPESTFPDAMPYVISRILPQAKAIFIVRDPVMRSRSQFYFMAKRCSSLNTTLNGPEYLHRSSMDHLHAFRTCMLEKDSDYYCALKYRAWAQHQPCPASLAVGISLYYIHLYKWFQHFPRDNFLILRTEDLEHNSTAVAMAMFEFLGLPPINAQGLSMLQKLEGQRSNAVEFLHKETQIVAELQPTYIWQETVEALRKFFEPYNRKLANLLNNDMYLFH